MLRKDIGSVVNLFDWSPVELHGLYNSAASGQHQRDKADIYVICLKWYTYW